MGYAFGGNDMRKIWIGLACLGLTGCQMVPQVYVPPPLQGDCGAARLAGYVGGPVTDLPAYGPWGVLRVIRPGMMVTMDYSATRLNAQVDRAGRILALSCG